ncbi:hypothetical protein MVEN_00720600 [Mycena venus]|uniref:Uncharacterized protein n=1 Tax=Mycena venus TaxID=2733690 RepID=A0A8H6YJP6_9AGAR|nr:hypothetical protein MVEN_00720600 [Mycena venus]
MTNREGKEITDKKVQALGVLSFPLSRRQHHIQSQSGLLQTRPRIRLSGLIVLLASATAISNQAPVFSPPFSTDPRWEGAQRCEGTGAGLWDLNPGLTHPAPPAFPPTRSPSSRSNPTASAAPYAAYPSTSAVLLRPQQDP